MLAPLIHPHTVLQTSQGKRNQKSKQKTNENEDKTDTVHVSTLNVGDT